MNLGTYISTLIVHSYSSTSTPPPPPPSFCFHQLIDHERNTQDENDYDVVFKINILGSAEIYTVKKVGGFPVPSRDVINQTLPGQEFLIIFPARESLVCDIPAGDGKTANLFNSVWWWRGVRRYSAHTDPFLDKIR